MVPFVNFIRSSNVKVFHGYNSAGKTVLSWFCFLTNGRRVRLAISFRGARVLLAHPLCISQSLLSFLFFKDCLQHGLSA